MAPVRPRPVIPIAVTVVTSRVPACIGYLSICGFPVSVAVGGSFEDARGGSDLGLGRLQDRVSFWPRPGRERLAEVAVAGVLGGDRLALPMGEPTGERAVPGGQVLDPLALLPRLLIRGQGEVGALGGRNSSGAPRAASSTRRAAWTSSALGVPVRGSARSIRSTASPRSRTT